MTLIHINLCVLSQVLQQTIMGCAYSRKQPPFRAQPPSDSEKQSAKHRKQPYEGQAIEIIAKPNRHTMPNLTSNPGIAQSQKSINLPSEMVTLEGKKVSARNEEGRRGDDGVSTKELLKKYEIKINNTAQRILPVNSYKYDTLLTHNPSIVDRQVSGAVGLGLSS